MKKRIQIGVMGPGTSASPKDIRSAEMLGKHIAEEGFVLISGGMVSGVMNAINKAYKEAGGTHAIGILSSKGERASEYLDVAIPTGMGSGRNYLNTQSSDIVVAIGDLSSAGTCSEVMLKLAETKKDHTPSVILLGEGVMVDAVCTVHRGHVYPATHAKQAMGLIKNELKERGLI